MLSTSTFQLPFRDSEKDFDFLIAMTNFQLPFRDSREDPQGHLPRLRLSTPFSGFRSLEAGIGDVSHLFQLPFRDSTSAGCWTPCPRSFNSLFGILIHHVIVAVDTEDTFQLPFRDSIIMMMQWLPHGNNFQLPFRDSVNDMDILLTKLLTFNSLFGIQHSRRV